MSVLSFLLVFFFFCAHCSNLQFIYENEIAIESALDIYFFLCFFVCEGKCHILNPKRIHSIFFYVAILFCCLYLFRWIYIIRKVGKFVYHYSHLALFTLSSGPRVTEITHLTALTPAPSSPHKARISKGGHLAATPIACVDYKSHSALSDVGTTDPVHLDLCRCLHHRHQQSVSVVLHCHITTPCNPCTGPLMLY